MTVRTGAVRDAVAPKEAEAMKNQPQPGGALNEREALAVALAGHEAPAAVEILELLDTTLALPL